MATLRAIGNNIIFQFVDEIRNIDDANRKQFKDQTDWGFTFSDKDESMQACRWGRIHSVGPDVKDAVFVGDEVLVTALKWTNGYKWDGELYWNTNEDQILLVNEAA